MGDTWLTFNGHIARENFPYLFLRPDTGSGGILRVHISELNVFGGELKILAGAKIKLLMGSVAEAGNYEPGICDGYGTACIGGIEICCNTSKVFRQCTGHWRCPQ